MIFLAIAEATQRLGGPRYSAGPGFGLGFKVWVRVNLKPLPVVTERSHTMSLLVQVYVTKMSQSFHLLCIII